MTMKNDKSGIIKTLQTRSAVWVCKTSRRILRLLGHGGTSLPGKLALKLCPDLLSRLATDKHIIVVSGTNGKTTTCGLIGRWLEKSGISVLSNRSGANLLAGITAELAASASLSAWGTKVYYAHPYSSWERSQNERSNGLYRRYAPKGQPMDDLSDDDVAHAADLICGLPRKKLGYYTPEELFEACLDKIYAA